MTQSQKFKMLHDMLVDIIVRGGGMMQYSNDDIAIMNIQFDLAYEVVYGEFPR
jgi:hypothetical protein